MTQRQTLYHDVRAAMWHVISSVTEHDATTALYRDVRAAMWHVINSVTAWRNDSAVSWHQGCEIPSRKCCDLLHFLLRAVCSFSLLMHIFARFTRSALWQMATRNAYVLIVMVDGAPPPPPCAEFYLLPDGEQPCTEFYLLPVGD